MRNVLETVRQITLCCGLFVLAVGCSATQQVKMDEMNKVIGNISGMGEDPLKDEVLKEQSLQRSGMVDTDTAVKVGKLVGARAVIFGEVSSATQQKFDKFAYDVIRTEVRVDARAVDVATGRVIFAESAQGQAEAKEVSDAHGGRISGIVDKDGEYIKAAQNASLTLAQRLGRKFALIGSVISVSGEQVITDLGSGQDVKKDDRIVLVRPIERLYHPTSKEPIGWKKQVLGIARVESVDAGSSTAAMLRRADRAGTIQPGDFAVLKPATE